MVAEITDFYIKQRRTICLAVIQATNDYARQPVLTKVRKIDAEPNRTLAIITKPDRLSSGSGTEVEESHFSIEERNDSEARFCRTSNFQVLPNGLLRN
ncbi:hypothetical protein LTR22_025699 [Elasticomyces elasticus]|nr:hypothetical protein LTR22_025699 [Elasticomyces elasticus]